MDRDIIFLMVMAAAVAVLACPLVAAQHPYVGGYFQSSVMTTNKVHMGITLSMNDPSQIPTPYGWLDGITCVAGGSGTTQTGYVYQNPVKILNNGSAIWWPQKWYLGNPLWDKAKTVGAYNWVAFHVRTDIASGTVTFKCYAYWRPEQYGMSDAPVIYTETVSTSDSNFLLGRVNHYDTNPNRPPGWHWVNFFQFGVESSVPLTNWDIIDKKPCYFSAGSWHYLPTYVNQGTDSDIVWDPSSGAHIGIGLMAYAGANKGFVADDFVEWKYTGTTIQTGTQLWGGSGTVTDVVRFPYV
jgi:hypothetical protein